MFLFMELIHITGKHSKKKNKYWESYEILRKIAKHCLPSPLILVFQIQSHMINGLENWKKECGTGRGKFIINGGNSSMVSELEIISLKR